MAGQVEFHDDVLEALFTVDGPVGVDIRKRTVHVQQTAVRSVQQPGTGRRYGKHVASAPGRPPATDTGRLANDIRSDVRVDEQGVVGTVGVSVDYGDDLELGTRHMEPRPFLRPSLRAAAD